MIQKIMQWVGQMLGWKPAKFTGVLPDPRHASEKRQDYLHEERAAAVTTDPFGNVKMTESPYPYYNQFFTYSCVAHGIGLGLAIERKNDTGEDYAQIAPTFAYRLRSNYPREGAALQDIFQKYRDYGAPLYTTLPTPQVEQLADEEVLTQAMYNEAEIFKGKTYFKVGTNYNDIQTLAAIAQTGHAVAILLYATEEEYSRQYPAILNPNLSLFSAEIQHCVAILPRSGFVENGKRYVMVQDSAWFGGWKYHYLSEDFIKARVYDAGYWDTVSVLGAGPRPKYHFTQNLKHGMQSQEVTQMQRLLISESLLPSDCATGYFGGLTLAGVKAFQARYASEILAPVGLTIPTGYWGPSSIAKANQLCA